jgi:signal peptidase II
MLTLIATAAALGALAVDQTSKALVLSGSGAAGSKAGFLSIRKVWMRRGPLMFFIAPRLQVGFWIASVVIAAVLLQARIIPDSAMSAAGIGAALGGAAGNLADRFRHGVIVDFIAIGRWPVFNLADAAIVVGVGLVVWSFVQT